LAEREREGTRLQFTVHVTRGISTLLTILPGEAMFLGRDSGQCQYILRDSSVSRRHCKLSVFGDRGAGEAGDDGV